MAKCGNSGSANIGGALTDITAWTLSWTSDAVPATTMSSEGWQEFIPCLSGGTGTLTTLSSAIVPGAKTECWLKEETTGSQYNFDCIVTSRDIAVTVGERIEYTYNFTVTGSITVS